MKFPVFSTRIWLAICAFLVTVVVILGVLLVKGHRGGRGAGLKLSKISRLELSQDKKREVRELFREHRRSHRIVAKELRRMERQLQRSLMDPATTAQQLEEAFAKISDQQRALERSRFSFTLKLRQLIGPANMRPLYRGHGKHGREGRRDDDHQRRGRDHRSD